MDRIGDRVWAVPAYLPYLQPTLTAQTLGEVERQFGVTLPSEYVQILRVQNGGYVRLHLPEEEHPQIPHSMTWGIGPHFPNIGMHCSGLDPEQAEAGDWVANNSERLIPFDGDGHWYLCLDFRHGDPPCVSYIDNELERDERIATSFEKFLGMLRP